MLSMMPLQIVMMMGNKRDSQPYGGVFYLADVFRDIEISFW